MPIRRTLDVVLVADSTVTVSPSLTPTPRPSTSARQERGKARRKAGSRAKTVRVDQEAKVMKRQLVKARAVEAWSGVGYLTEGADGALVGEVNDDAWMDDDGCNSGVRLGPGGRGHLYGPG